MGVCICSMFCCTLLYFHSSIAIILVGKRELVALLNLSSWCLVMVERLFLAVPRGCLRFVIVVFFLSYSLTIFGIEILEQVATFFPVSISYYKLSYANWFKAMHSEWFNIHIKG